MMSVFILHYMSTFKCTETLDKILLEASVYEEDKINKAICIERSENFQSSAEKSTKSANSANNPSKNINTIINNRITQKISIDSNTSVPQLLVTSDKISNQTYYIELLAIQMRFDRFFKNCELFSSVGTDNKINIKSINKLFNIRFQAKSELLKRLRNNFSSKFSALFYSKDYLENIEKDLDIKLYNRNLIRSIYQIAKLIRISLDREEIYNILYTFMISELVMIMKGNGRRQRDFFLDKSSISVSGDLRLFMCTYAFFYLYNGIHKKAMIEIDSAFYIAYLKKKIPILKNKECKHCSMGLFEHCFIYNNDILYLTYCESHKDENEINVLNFYEINGNFSESKIPRDVIFDKIKYLSNISDKCRFEALPRNIIYAKKMADFTRYLINNAKITKEIYERLKATINSLEIFHFNVYHLLEKILEFELQNTNKYDLITDDLSIVPDVSNIRISTSINSKLILDIDLQTIKELVKCVGRMNSIIEQEES